MSPQLAFVLTGVLDVLAFFGGRAIARARRGLAIGCLAILVALLIAKAVLNHRPDWEFRLFPYVEYVWFQSWLLFPIGLAALGLASSLVGPGRSRRALRILAWALVAFSLWTERWILVEPDVTSQVRAGADHHVMQTEPWTCGPAACVSVLSRLGIPATEGEMIGLCRTASYGGTSYFRIWRGLRLKLPEDEYEVTIVKAEPSRLHRRQSPGIVSLRTGHVAAIGFEDDEIVIHDPAEVKPRRMMLEAFLKECGDVAVVVRKKRD